ncbi:MAG: hypothetical protein J6B48_02880 [Clostridia bacterium]|nr:hypothetical protein [Clostridia bacterium]
MKCGKHVNSDAVAQCKDCGIGVCAICVEEAKFARDSGEILCLDCYKKTLEWAISDKRETARKIGNRIKGKLIFYFIGLACILAEFLFNLGGPGLGMGIFFCGIYMGISGWKAGAEAHENWERKHGVTYEVTSDGIVRDEGIGGKAILFVLYLAFGIIATPISCLLDKRKKSEAEKVIMCFENELLRVNNL